MCALAVLVLAFASASAATVQVLPAEGGGALARAVETLRAQGGGTVELKDGVFELAAPLELTAADCHLVFAAAPGARPVVSAGRRIVEWRVDARGWWHAAVEKGTVFSQFYVNGQRRLRPFLPRRGYFYVKEAAPENQREASEAAFLKPGDFPQGDNPALEFCLFHNWKMSRSRVLDYDSKTGLVRIGIKKLKNDFDAPSSERWYRLDNVKSALGEPGDWYLDSVAGELVYVPKSGETPANCVCTASRLAAAVNVNGSEDVVFRGIDFAFADDGVRDMAANQLPQSAAYKLGMVNVMKAKEVRFEDCGFLNCGAYGLALVKGTRLSGARRCDFADVGCGGVRVGDGYDYQPADGLVEGCFVERCRLEHGGRVDPTGPGILVCHARATRLSHNDIRDFYYSGISCGWGWCYAITARDNIIEYNDIDQIGQHVLSDMGGIYTLSRQPGTKIRFNRIRNVTRARYGAFGLYFDSGSSLLEATDNLVEDSQDHNWFQADLSASNLVARNVFVGAHATQLNFGNRTTKNMPTRFVENDVVWSRGRLHCGDARPSAIEFAGNLCYRADDIAAVKLPDGFAYAPKGAVRRHALPAADFGSGRPARQLPSVPAVWTAAPPRPELPLAENFEQVPVGEGWPKWTNSNEHHPEMIRVVEGDAAEGTRSVEFTQKLTAWRPHVYRSISRERGLQRISFAFRQEPGAAFYFEVRDGALHAAVDGPSVQVGKDGMLYGRGGALGKVPQNVWVRVELSFQLGAERPTDTYAVKVWVPGEPKAREYPSIRMSRDFRTIGWVGFMSAAHEGARFRIDDFRLH